MSEIEKIFAILLRRHGPNGMAGRVRPHLRAGVLERAGHRFDGATPSEDELSKFLAQDAIAHPPAYDLETFFYAGPISSWTPTQALEMVHSGAVAAAPERPVETAQPKTPEDRAALRERLRSMSAAEKLALANGGR